VKPAPAAPAVLPPPANTLPANASPPPAAATPKTHAEVYEALKKSDPFKAAAYLRRYMPQIYGPGHTPPAT
jgi:DNA-binding GntR family transcriptional regulator